jgi:hypothetical protein
MLYEREGMSQQPANHMPAMWEEQIRHGAESMTPVPQRRTNVWISPWQTLWRE